MHQPYFVLQTSSARPAETEALLSWPRTAPPSLQTEGRDAHELRTLRTRQHFPTLESADDARGLGSEVKLVGD